MGMPIASASMPTFGTYDVLSVFHIAKSRNRNQVHYGVRLDETCQPANAQPVYAYWRELEKGPNVVSPLLGREKPAYGLQQQRVERRTERGGTIVAHLRAFRQRPVTIATFENGGTCGARAVTEIGGEPAELHAVFVQLGTLWSVRHIELQGRRLRDDMPVREIIRR
jgi:hypothetical protein